MDPPLVAHRGFPLEYPENTLPGIEAALRCGAGYVEIDVQLTRDEVPVLFHDDTTDRVCGVPGSIHRRSLEDIRSLSAHEPDAFGDRYLGTPIPKLEDVARRFRRTDSGTLFVEIKPVVAEHIPVSRAVCKVLEALGDLDPRRSVVLSSSLDILAACRWLRKGPVGLVLASSEQGRDASVRALAPEYVFLNALKLLRHGAWVPEGARLVVYDVVDPGVAARLLRRGAHLVETFDVCRMLQASRGAA